ncbi:MAG TPA: hypothetical protein VIT92_07245 [Burkholderiaceae bacterium]
MTVLRTCSALACAMLATAAGPTLAADPDTSQRYNFSGFGTLAWSHQNDVGADYVRPGQPKRSPFGLDSNLGLQGSASFNDMFSATVQVLARREYSDNAKAAVEWAFLKAKAGDNLSVRAGRVALPAYLMSDSRHIGYANTAIRPPVEVYGQVPLSSLNGVDVTATHTTGEVGWTLQAGYGKMKNRFESATIEGRHTVSLALTAETGPVTLRLGHVRTDLTITGSPQLQSILGGLRLTGFGALASRLEAVDKSARFTGLGLSMDYKNVLLQSELTRRTTDSYVSDNTGKYLMLGYRIGNFVPYASYGKLDTDSPRSDSTVPLVGPLLPLAGGVNALVNGDDQNSTTVGLRWNAFPSASIKFQFDRVRPDGGDGYLVRIQPGYRGQAVHVFSTAVDVVF